MLMNSFAIFWMHWTDTWIQTPSKCTHVRVLQSGLKKDSWLQNVVWKAGYKTKICTKPTEIFLKVCSLAWLCLPFENTLLNISQLLSPHHECFKISVLRTGFLIVFINNNHTVTLSTTIITLVYHLKATKLHRISTGRKNTTPNALANPSRCYSFRGPSASSAVWP